MKIGLIAFLLGAFLIIGNVIAADGDCPNCHKKGDAQKMSECKKDCHKDCDHMKKDGTGPTCEKHQGKDGQCACKDGKDCKKDGQCTCKDCKKDCPHKKKSE